VGVTAVQTGDVWVARLDPTIAHGQGGRRPVVVVSSSGLHGLPIGMIVVVPLTGFDRGLVTQPRIASPASGLRQASFARPEDVRSIDVERLDRHLGRVTGNELTEIRKVLRYFLDL
jgi:mRNA interferase MazF